ncbi:MAG: hypothetical protein CVU08_02205 [Bacteroidetes bacterium HGW-Bacteroidetes-3]|jgi:hypothetical protein|nr:MAG: hypothetical protein CVU08_02205 [Bacteroidetes bacterium HGW-Bacteroidetes-3]
MNLINKFIVLILIYVDEFIIIIVGTGRDLSVRDLSVRDLSSTTTCDYIRICVFYDKNQVKNYKKSIQSKFAISRKEQGKYAKSNFVLFDI